MGADESPASCGGRPSPPFATTLYRDDAGTWARLDELFWSGDARCLVSGALESSSVEVDSVYCPACLELVSESDAAAHRGRCASCVACPLCGTAARPARVPVDGAAAAAWSYLCGHCCWSHGRLI